MRINWRSATLGLLLMLGGVGLGWGGGELLMPPSTWGPYAISGYNPAAP